MIFEEGQFLGLLQLGTTHFHVDYGSDLGDNHSAGGYYTYLGN